MDFTPNRATNYFPRRAQLSARDVRGSQAQNGGKLVGKHQTTCETGAILSKSGLALEAALSHGWNC